MKKTVVFFTIMLVILAHSVPAFARGGSHRPGPVHAQDDWPTGLVELLNRGGRVNGNFINANDFFFFAGDSEAFNAFIKQYATLKNTPLRLILHSGVGMTGSLSGEQNIPFEWKVSAERWHDDPSGAPTLVTMELRLGGLVQLDKIKIPPDVEVKSGGEIEKFVAGHEAKRKAAPQRETIQPSPEMVETTGRPPAVITTGEPYIFAEPPDREEAPDFSLKALNDKTIKLSALKGKVVILNFWATWAPACMAEMAALEEFHRAYKENLVVLGLSVDSVDSDNTAAVRAYIEKKNITYPILIAPREILYDYEIAIEKPIETIPTTIIIDKNGFIRGKRVGAQRKVVLERAYLSACNAHGQVTRPEHIKTSKVTAFNFALSLDGDGNYVQIADSGTLYTNTPFTIEAWFNAKEFGERGAIIANDEYEVHISNRGTIQVWDNPSSDLEGTTTISTDMWYHVASVNDGASRKIFLNGQFDVQSDMSSPIGDRNQELWIGNDPDLSYRQFTGLIDEVRIWNIARTEEQIQTTMNTTLQGDEEGLVAYWNFDDGSAVDLSLNGNDGRLHGDARIVEEKLPEKFIHKGVSVVSIENKTANPGEQFTVMVSGRFVEAIDGFSFALTFDPSVLQAISIQEGTFLNRDGADATSLQTSRTLANSATIDNKNGVVRNIRCSRRGKERVVDAGVLAIVTFEAGDTGSADLTIQNLALLSPPSASEKIQACAKHGKVDVYAHGSISGVVLNSESNEPIEDAKVEVLKDGFSFGLSAYSGKDGKYTIKNVPAGIFDLTVYRDKYLPETVEKIQVKERETTSNVKLMMESLQPIDGFRTNPWER